MESNPSFRARLSLLLSPHQQRINEQLADPHVQFTFLEQAEDVRGALSIFMDYFSNSQAEIAAGLSGELFKDDEEQYSYGQSYLPALVRRDNNECVAVAIVVEKVIHKKHVVHELVWFATRAGVASAGYGAMLFSAIHAFVSSVKVYALLVESTNRALSWWLSRRGVPIVSSVTRCGDRIDLMDPTSRLAPTDEEHTKIKSILGDLLGAGEEERPVTPRGKTSRRGGSGKANSKKKPPAKHASHFRIKPYPLQALDSIYTDTVFRDKRGNATKSCSKFVGQPYRYSVEQATHIVFPISPNLVALLGKRNIVLAKSKNKRAPQRDSLEYSISSESLLSTISSETAESCTSNESSGIFQEQFRKLEHLMDGISFRDITDSEQWRQMSRSGPAQDPTGAV